MCHSSCPSHGLLPLFLTQPVCLLISEWVLAGPLAHCDKGHRCLDLNCSPMGPQINFCPPANGHGWHGLQRGGLSHTKALQSLFSLASVIPECYRLQTDWKFIYLSGSVGKGSSCFLGWERHHTVRQSKGLTSELSASCQATNAVTEDPTFRNLSDFTHPPMTHL